MTMLFLLCILLFLPCVDAEEGWWDDFSNNLASDLAPILALFGEQVTKQYLSESINILDYFIFAMAPIGIITTAISAIRVCGSPSLRAFIGRAQEGAGNAEAELCSSTSRDVCELYNNGGIARVFGRPKILEIVYDPKTAAEDTAGIHTFRGFIRGNQKEWKHSSDSEESASETFAPNLSLNIGIKRRPVFFFWAIAVLGICLQASVLALAIAFTYVLKIKKGEQLADPYACPLVLVGTALLCSGVFFCAFLIGRSTKKHIFTRKSRQISSTIYWVQPGGQVLGDQVFDSFCYSDHDEPLLRYISSQKVRSGYSRIAVKVAIAFTILGFILQFIGLRGIHSGVAIAQLGAIIIMSTCRAWLRMQRLKPGDNHLATRPDEVVGHELDWLALHIGQKDMQRQLGHISNQSNSLSANSTSDTGPACTYLWRFCGASSSMNTIMRGRSVPGTPRSPRVASRILAYRARLAHLTLSPYSRAEKPLSAGNFEAGMVEVRETSQQLARAIEDTVNTIFSRSPKIQQQWQSETSIRWEIACSIGSISQKFTDNDSPLDSFSEMLVRDTSGFSLKRSSSDSPWVLEDRLLLEALLGLWVWSIKSDPRVEIKDLQTQLYYSRAPDIPMRRIVATSKKIAKLDLKMWFGQGFPALEKHTLCLDSRLHADPSIVLTGNKDKEPFQPLSTRLPTELDKGIIRFFGWHAIAPKDHHDLEVWSAPTQKNSLISLCAQEVFGFFIRSISSVIDDFGDIKTKQEGRDLHLVNDLVSDLVRSFLNNELGQREDALLCILPPLLSQLRLSNIEGILETARNSAIQHRRRKEWIQAEHVLQWSWNICNDALSSPMGAPIDQTLIGLGELYRWALINNETKKFGLSGIAWLREQKSELGQKLSLTSQAIINRYQDATDMLSDQVADNTRLSGAVDDGLTMTLLCLTLPISHTEEEKGKALCRAAKYGWREVVSALLELGTEPDFKDPSPHQESRTALSQAAKSGNFDIVKDLLSFGAYPNLTSIGERTALSYASDEGHCSIVELLLKDSRVDPTTSDINGITPLAWAIRKGHLETVRHLLNTGNVDPNVKDQKGYTPASYAVIMGHDTIMKLLLNTKSFNPDGRNGHDETPLLLAAQYGRDTIAKLLLDTGTVDPDARNSLDQTPLLIACRYRRVAVVKLLLDTGKVDPDSRDKFRSTPLLQAAEEGGEAIVKILLDAGRVDPNARNKFGHTPLTTSAENGHPSIVKMLLDTKKVHVRFALLRAAERDHEAVVRLLLEVGNAEPNVKDDTGETPLGAAARMGHKATVKLLLGVDRVDLNSQDTLGKTPLHWAAHKNHKAIVKLLLNTAHIDPDIKSTSTGRTPLSSAAAQSSERAMKLLLQDHRVDPNAKGLSGRTPLSYAAERGTEVVLRLLLQDDRVDPDAKDASGRTPLSWAVRKDTPWNVSTPQSQQRDAIKWLLHLGKPDPNAKDDDGNTPFSLALHSGDDALVELLREHCGQATLLSGAGS